MAVVKVEHQVAVTLSLHGEFQQKVIKQGQTKDPQDLL
jgi:hypothetical protein